MLFASRIGVVNSAFYRSKRLIAIFVIPVIAVVIIPSGDMSSLFCLWVPMCLLYELGIWICAWHERHDDSEMKTPDSQELIEV